MPEGPTCGVDEAARILQMTANGIYAPRKEVQTLEEFKKRFTQGYMTGNRLKASGVAHKETYWRLYVEPLLGKKRLDEITDEDVQRLKASMGKKNPKTVNNALTLLSKMLKVALEWKVIDRLPATIRLLKPGHTEMEFYEEDDFVRLVDGAAAADERTYITVLLGGEAGLRSGEMTALEWPDIDFRRSLLHVNRSEWEGKSGRRRAGVRGQAR